MNLENIKAEYKNFIEHICYAHSILYDLSIDTNKFLCQYIKSKSYNKDFAEKLEINLLHLENMLQNTENIMDYIESTTIPKMSLPEPNNLMIIHLLQMNMIKIFMLI